MALYIPSDATTWATRMVKAMPFNPDAHVLAADSIAKIIWMAAPWRWTLGSIDPTLTIVAGTQDYAFTKPADFLYLEKSYIWDGSKEIPLRQEAFLPTLVTSQNVPSRITYVSSGGDKLRIAPRPQVGGTLVNIYKKTYTPITAANIGNAGALIMPDEWTWVFEQGILWQAYLYADDARAGNVVVTNDGKRQYSGQHGSFLAAIQEMREAEKPFMQSPGGDQQRG